jgi:hypothetical protein
MFSRGKSPAPTSGDSRSRPSMSASSLSPRPPGFRFWWTDAAVIIACVVLTWLVWRPLGPLALFFPVTLGHFFLFCNVFRLRRKYEVVWTALYVLNVAGWLIGGELNWPGVLALQTPVTIAAITLEIKSPRYHGVFWKKVNPCR